MGGGTGGVVCVIGGGVGTGCKGRGGVGVSKVVMVGVEG